MKWAAISWVLLTVACHKALVTQSLNMKAMKAMKDRSKTRNVISEVS